MRNVLSMTAALLLLGLVAPPAWSQVESIEMRVDGLACPFCAYGLEKKLKEVPGVSNVEIRVNGGIVILRSEKGESIDVDGLKPAVKEAGFTEREIAATATGNVVTVEHRSVLEIRGTDTEFLLEENPILKDLQSKLKGTEHVRLTGRLEQGTSGEHHGYPFIMTVETFELRGSGTE